MSKEPKVQEKGQVDAAYNFAVGKITLHEFKRNTPGYQRKWKHLKFLKYDPYLWQQFLLKLPVHLRLKALLDAEAISLPQLKNNMGISNAGEYINQEYPVYKIVPETLYKLAILFDVPMHYVLAPNNRFRQEEFVEYVIVAEDKELDYVISWSLEKAYYRIIEGFMVDNSTKVFPFIKDNVAYVRVDKNVGFSRFEIFLTSHICPNIDQLKLLNNKFKGLVDSIYIVDSLFRHFPKLSIIVRNNDSRSDSLKNHLEYLKSQARSERIYPFKQINEN
ncbi:hypothetical protein ACERII_20385 [Evansella sp. AB-rgal1]|uniref:hypothetical protein n=1 Tax=Evansella sp. AB-rgal1 TaxID=3242696 RepID=UPI00359DB2DC